MNLGSCSQCVYTPDGLRFESLLDQTHFSINQLLNHIVEFSFRYFTDNCSACIDIKQHLIALLHHRIRHMSYNGKFLLPFRRKFEVFNFMPALWQDHAHQLSTTSAS